MAYRGNDPYEEARMKALVEETDAKRKLNSAVGPAYNFNPSNKSFVVQDPEKYYRPQNFYYEDEPLYEEDEETGELRPVTPPNAPADLTDVPTSTTNVKRPRTVAAGYDANRSVLTVVFRDGTIWNYDNVTPGEWQNFHASISKGRPWINDGLFGVGQEADMANIQPEVQAAIYNEARKAQLMYQSKYKYRTGIGNTTARRLGKAATARAQASLNAPTPKKGGVNRSKGGKPPKR